MTVLYISYDGMLEPLGQSQVLGYLELLAAGRSIHLLSFEKAEDWQDAGKRRLVVKRIAAAGIHWHPLRYHKRPSSIATAWDVLCGVACGLMIVLRHRVTIVHARSYVPALMALSLKRLTGVSFLFDMRGFWADERVDGGIWPQGSRLYFVAKWFERHFLTGADHVISLTRAAAKEIASFDYLRDRCPPITVIPTCADLDRFRLSAVPHEGPFVLGYVGSAGTWHMFDAVAASFRILRERLGTARLLVLNRGEHAFIRDRLAAAGIPDDAVELRSASHQDVPMQMSRMNAGIFFYKPSYSRIACAPTKLGEFLGCGIPCLSNRGVGDMDDVLRSARVGIALDEFELGHLRAGVEGLLELADDPKAAARCVATAQDLFSLTSGVTVYRQVYADLETAA